MRWGIGPFRPPLWTAGSSFFFDDGRVESESRHGFRQPAPLESSPVSDSDSDFRLRVEAKSQEIFGAIQESEGKDPDNELADLNLVNIVAVLTGKLAVAEVHLDELHDRILDLEGRSDEKPDRTP